MAAGGGKPRWGVDICSAENFLAGIGRGLLAVEMEGSGAPVETATGEKREAGGVLEEYSHGKNCSFGVQAA